MLDYRHDLKGELTSLKKSTAELSRASCIPYKRLSGFFCQYWFLSHDEERQVRNILLLWEEERQQKEGRK